MKKKTMTDDLRHDTAQHVESLISAARAFAETQTTLDRLDEIVIHEKGYDCVRVQGYFMPVEDVELDGDEIITDETLVALKEDLLALKPLVELVA